jgi:hypothetical protein
MDDMLRRKLSSCCILHFLFLQAAGCQVWIRSSGPTSATTDQSEPEPAIHHPTLHISTVRSSTPLTVRIYNLWNMKAWMYSLPLLLATLLPGCILGVPMLTPETLMSRQATESAPAKTYAKCPDCQHSTKRRSVDRPCSVIRGCWGSHEHPNATPCVGTLKGTMTVCGRDGCPWPGRVDWKKCSGGDHCLTDCTEDMHRYNQARAPSIFSRIFKKKKNNH